MKHLANEAKVRVYLAILVDGALDEIFSSSGHTTRWIWRTYFETLSGCRSVGSSQCFLRGMSALKIGFVS